MSLVVLLALAITAGCDRAVTLATTQHASWQYVEAAWGGAALNAVRLTGTDLTLTLRLGLHPPTRLDSGICVGGVAAHLHGRRILFTLNKAVCSGRAAVPPYSATVRRPPPGMYDVVYNDGAAGVPRLGRLRLGQADAAIVAP